MGARAVLTTELSNWSPASSRSDAIFGRRIDRIVFLVPVALAFLNYLFGQSNATSAVLLVAATVGFDLHHVMHSYPVMWRKYSRGLLQVGSILSVCLLAPALLLIVYKFAPSFFYPLIAYSQLFHLIRQQYGWIRVSHKVSGRKEGLSADVICLTAIAIGPLAWWHSPLSKLPATSLNPNDIYRVVPEAAAIFLLGSSVLVIIGYLYNQWRQQTLDVTSTRFMILASTAAWLFGGFVILEDNSFIWIAFAVGHGLPYMVLTSRATVAPFREGRYHLTKGKNFALFLSLTLMASLGLHLFGDQVATDTLPWQMEPLFWTPIFIHYFMDAIIWRNRFDPQYGL